MKDGIVIQARSGSTRMPAKILLPFDGERRIIDILIDNLRRDNPGIPVILATTVNPADDVLEEVARQHGIECWRGSEEDVLDRFIGAAEHFGIDLVARVCSDNPFLVTSSFSNLFDLQGATGADYAAYAFPDGRPTIKSHLGLFPEVVTTKALKRVSAISQSKLDHEHVTIGIYTRPEEFSSAFLELPDFLQERTDLRLTLDTPEDFVLLQELYKRIHNEKDASVEALVRLVDSDPGYGKIMKQNIARNEK